MIDRINHAEVEMVMWAGGPMIATQIKIINS